MTAVVALGPCRTVRRSALIVLVPAILDPLIDTAAHIVQPEWICLEASHLDGLLLGGCDGRAVPAVGQAGLQLVAPPVLRLGSAARGVLPLGLGREPVWLAGGTREPGDIMPGVIPAHVGDRGVVLARCDERA